MSNYYFKYPFAIDGDVTAIPPDPQPDGSVSYQDGYTINYEQNLLTVPTALPIDRAQFNQLMYAITSNVAYYQQHALPYWISSTDNLGTPYAYDQYAQVRYNIGSPGNDGPGTLNYINMIDGNTSTPGADNTWLPIGYYVGDQILFASSVALTTATPINLFTLVLPPGQWLVQGNANIEFDSTSGPINYAQFWLNTTSVTAPDYSRIASIYSSGVPSGIINLTPPITILTSTVGSPTTVYLSGAAYFTTGTAKVCGTIAATPFR
jgi:hypothetical protein